MADMELDDFLHYHQLSYRNEDIYDFQHWSGLTSLESHAAAQPALCLDDIEHMFTELHKCVDQVVAEISIRTPPQLDQIREQNRKLIDKLTTLESAITGSAAAVVLGSGSQVCPSTSASGLDQVRLCGKRRRVSQSTSTRTASASTPDAPSEPPSESSTQRSQSKSQESLSPGRQGGDPKLFKKLLQIGDQEARSQVAEFAAQLKAPGLQNAPPNPYQFSNLSQITDVSHFLRLVVDLGMAIESSILGEQNFRIRKRIALAHFYHAYTLAQDHPEMFLSWCDDQRVQGDSIMRKGGYKSVVQHRFADLIFSRTENYGATSSDCTLDNGEDAKKRAAKIQMWRKSGKKWSQMIQRFGYGILLLLPSSLSDEDLRIAQDQVVVSCLNLIDSRKHLFAEVLQQANELLEAHLFSHDGTAHLTNTHYSGRFEQANWYNLLNIPSVEN